MFKRGTWKTGGRQRSQRFIQRVRRKGVTLSFWQRTTEKRYRADVAMRAAGGIFVEDVYNSILDALEWSKGETAHIVDMIIEETEIMAKELETQTPYDPNGPNDPPLHARDAWRFKVETRGKSVLLSVSNPKDYMAFLEERGGRSDHPGANVGGWISDAFNHFALRLRGRLT